MRSARLLVLCMAVLTLVVACRTEPVVVTVNAAGSDRIRVTYELDDQVVTNEVDSPFSTDLEASGSYTVRVRVESVPEGSFRRMSCGISTPDFDGEDVVARGRGTAAVCRATVRSAGNFDFSSRVEAPEEIVVPGEGRLSPDRSVVSLSQADFDFHAETLEVPEPIRFEPDVEHSDVTDTHLSLSFAQGTVIIDLVTGEHFSFTTDSAGPDGVAAAHGDPAEDGLAYVTTCATNEVGTFELNEDAALQSTFAFDDDVCPYRSWVLGDELWLQTSTAGLVVIDRAALQVVRAYGQDVIDSSEPLDIELFEGEYWVVGPALGDHVHILTHTDEATAADVRIVSIPRPADRIDVVADRVVLYAAEFSQVSIGDESGFTRLPFGGDGIDDLPDGRVLGIDTTNVRPIDPVEPDEFQNPVWQFPRGRHPEALAVGPELLVLLQDGELTFRPIAPFFSPLVEQVE